MATIQLPVRTMCPKAAGESKVYDFDFFNDLAEDEDITGTPTITQTSTPAESPATTLTIGAVSIQDTKAQARISGGAAGCVYHLKVTAATTDSNTLVHCGDLKVTAC